MPLLGRWAARLALLAHLTAVHLVLTRPWYAGGLRKAFTILRNVHIKDLLLAVELAKGDGGDGSAAAEKPPLAASAVAGVGRLALLFMLRRRLEHADLWKSWLEPERSRAVPRVSLYFHLADGLDQAAPEDVEALRALPGARSIVATVATGWCELMAAEVALLKAALADDLGATMFVLLPHDAVMLAPLDLTLAALLTPTSSWRKSGGSHQDDLPRTRTRICLAGVRGLEVPAGCPHAIEPHWSRSLLLKHHQWMALNRLHAEHVSQVDALRNAVAIFQEWFLGEPVCSDEVLPLLSLAAWRGPGINHTSSEDLHELPLYKSAAQGLRPFADGLRELDISAECITYAPWPGCRPAGRRQNKRAKSPTAGGGLSPDERDALMVELAAAGVLFCRKLGLGGGNGKERPRVSDHLNLITAAAEIHRDVRPGELVAPHRLLPLKPSSNMQLLEAPSLHLRWMFASWEAQTTVTMQVAVAAVVATCTGYGALWGGAISAGHFRWLLAIFVLGHFIFFVLSVVLFAEYSLLQPLRKAGFLSNPEL